METPDRLKSVENKQTVMMMHRFRFRGMAGASLFAAFVLFLTLLTGCEQPSGPLPIRIVHGAQPGALLVMLAREQAYFEQEGLAPTYTSYPSGKRALDEGLVAEKADIASCSDLPAVDILRTANDLVILSSLQAARSINRVIARKDRGITQISDLANKRVGTQQNSAVHFFLDRALQANGIDPGRVTHVYYPAEQLVSALAEGKVDALSMREPFVSQALAQLGKNGIAIEAPWVYPQFEVLVVRRGYAETHEEEIERVLRALLRAERFLNEQPQQAAAILARSMELPQDKVEQILAQTINRVSLTQALLSMAEIQQGWLNSQSHTTPRASIDLLDFFYPAPLQAVDALRIDVAGFSQQEVR